MAEYDPNHGLPETPVTDSEGKPHLEQPVTGEDGKPLFEKPVEPKKEKKEKAK